MAVVDPVRVAELVLQRTLARIVPKSVQNLGLAGARKISIRIFAVLLVLYLAFLGTLVIFENRLIYQSGSGHPNQAMPGIDGVHVEDVWISTSDGLRLHALNCTAPLHAPTNDTVVLYLHGNRGIAVRRLPVAAEWLATLNAQMVVIVDYRGYGLSEGAPSEAGLYKDADAAWRWLVQELGVRPEQIVVVGRSLGGAIAVELATTHQIGGLVLENTFCTLPEVAQAVIPWVPCNLLMQNRYSTIDRICKYSGPLIVAHGREDELIPPEHSRRLFQAASKPKRFVEIPTLRHMDSPTKDYYESVRVFFALLHHPRQ